MIFTTNINNAEKKVLMQEALAKQERVILGVLYTHAIDPASFDETTFEPSADNQEWEQDLARKCANIVALKARIAELG